MYAARWYIGLSAEAAIARTCRLSSGLASTGLTLMSSGCGDGLAGTEALSAIDDDLSARSGAAVKDGGLAFSQSNFYRLHLCDLAALAVAVHDPDEERSVQPCLDGG